MLSIDVRLPSGEATVTRGKVTFSKEVSEPTSADMDIIGEAWWMLSSSDRNLRVEEARNGN